jgi:hypothetical protein
MFLAIITAAKTFAVMCVARYERQFTEVTRKRSRCKRSNKGIKKQSNRISNSNSRRLLLSRRASNLCNLDNRVVVPAPAAVARMSLPTSEGRLAAEYRRLFRCLVSVSILQFSDLWLILAKLSPGAIAQRVNVNAGCVCNHQRSSRGPACIPLCQGSRTRMGRAVCPSTQAASHAKDHTLINCFSIEQIETHLESLNNGLQLPPLKLKQKCLESPQGITVSSTRLGFQYPCRPC